MFLEKSVNTGEVSGSLSDQTIRENIQDEYFRDSTITIPLAGARKILKACGLGAVLQHV